MLVQGRGSSNTNCVVLLHSIYLETTTHFILDATTPHDVQTPCYIHICVCEISVPPELFWHRYTFVLYNVLYTKRHIPGTQSVSKHTTLFPGSMTYPHSVLFTIRYLLPKQSLFSSFCLFWYIWLCHIYLFLKSVVDFSWFSRFNVLFPTYSIHIPHSTIHITAYTLASIPHSLYNTYMWYSLYNTWYRL